jgi:starch phosphorylase
MAIPDNYLLPSLPAELEGLNELALDLRWAWNHVADALWKRIDSELWNTTGNPWLILQLISRKRLRELAGDPSFRKAVDHTVAEYREAFESSTWFGQAYASKPFNIVYFSMEYGLGEALPIYSGGLGILAGDYLKTASDLGIPVIGIGLLYQQGYFRQAVDSNGRQTELFPYNDPSQLPITPVRDREGEWLRLKLDLPGRALWIRIWEARVGRVRLYLLDTNDPVNSPSDRGITSELYGGGQELRLQQEIILGIGGWQLVKALGKEPEVCHLNEGHAALAIVERAHDFMTAHSQPFGVALAATRAGNIFTTHTPVEAGFDRFPIELIEHYLAGYAEDLGIGIDGLTGLGRRDPKDTKEPLNMAFLAMRGAGMVNGVSRLHGEVSRQIFQPLYPRWPASEVPITHVTNGVHVPSWDSAAADICWTDACGKSRWLDTMENIQRDFRKVSDGVLWNLRMEETEQLINFIRDRLAQQIASTGASHNHIPGREQIFDPNVLTLGFARRFTGYKRPNLLLRDPERLTAILNHPRHPVQLVIAGKAHPHDEEGKTLVQEWWQYSLRPEVQNRVAFISDYDMALAEQLVNGVDVWINTPRRPWEACGTSGMKVLVNGGLNLSELDGWWAEAFQPGTGWAIGDGREHGNDPNWDNLEAEQVYSLLENEVVPCFYDRDDIGIPRAWVARMRKSMAELTPQFSANRMMREYVDRMYSLSARNYRERGANNAKEALRLYRWHDSLKQNWHQLRFINLDIFREGENYIVTVTVYVDGLDPSFIEVQLYAEPLDGGDAEIHVMERTEPSAGTPKSHLYQVKIPARRPVEHYTPRIVPRLDGAAVPLEAACILWYESL